MMTILQLIIKQRLMSFKDGSGACYPKRRAVLHRERKSETSERESEKKRATPFSE